MEEPHGNAPDLTTAQKAVVWFLVTASLFMGCFGFLGFLGWWHDPSSQKWAALGVSFFGFAGAFVFYGARHEVVGANSESEITDCDEAIAKEPRPEQFRYWKKQMLVASAGIFILSAVGWAVFYFWGELHDYRLIFYLALAQWWYSYLRRIFHCVRHFRKLKRQS